MKNNNTYKIIKYFVLWIFFSFISIKIKELILYKLIQNNFQEIQNNIFSFYEVHNKGAAFNLFTDKSNEIVLASVICMIICITIILAKTSKLNQTMISSMALLSSGMLMNTVERIQTGYVTDYMYFTFLKNFPVFNLADVMIVTGAIVLAISLTFTQKAEHD